MRRIALLMMVGLSVVAGCSESSSPTLAPEGPRFTGYIGGGGRAADSDSTGTSGLSADNTGYIGGGGRAADSTTTPPY